MHEAAIKAEIQTDVCIKRFLSLMPGGKKIFVEKKSSIKNEMTADEVAEWFRDMLEKIEKRVKVEKSTESAMKEEKEEKFVFPINHTDDIPKWAHKIQKELEDIKIHIFPKEDEEIHSSEESEVLAFRQERPNYSGKGKKRDICSICSKQGHSDKVCFYRICSSCQGKGHDREQCPSEQNRLKPRQKNFTRRPSHE